MAISKSIYEELVLESNDQKRTVDIRNGAIAIEYFEDIFSPTITARVKVVNTGNTITSFKDQDGEKQSIYNGLPLRGGERLSMKIAGNVPGRESLDFSSNPKKYLYVSSITDVISEDQRESFTLNLVSREAITNETSRVMRKYPTSSKISESVRKILTDVLKTDSIGTIDETSNQYGFVGNMKKPFTTLIWLASKGVPVVSGNTTAGFVFYQTRDGFQFRAIDNLISQESKATYVYNPTTVSYNVNNEKVDNEFKILNYSTDKNQNLIEKLRLGTYASHRTFFNPLNFTFTDYQKGLFKLKNYVNKTNNLGSTDLRLPKISEGSNLSLGDAPSRIITAILDIGTMEPEVSRSDENADPTLYQSQSLMRYNILFTQSLSVMIAVNTDLRAGDVIECLFPKNSKSDKNEHDSETSGLYMIKELCHHFDVNNSYTSMKLLRDTFGVNNKERK
jgi:hypothetical protein